MAPIETRHFPTLGPPERNAHPRSWWGQVVWLLPVGLVALWSGLWVLRATPHGAVITPDSAFYLGVANNLRHGRGLTSPFAPVPFPLSPRVIVSRGRVASSGYPPGYPIALAAVSLVSGTVRGAARVLDILLAPLNLLLVGILTARMIGHRSWVLPVLPPLMLLLIADTDVRLFEGGGWLPSHVSAWSEPLFTALLTLAVLVLGQFLSRTGRASGSRTGRANGGLAAGAVLAAGALMTRYLGVSIVILGAIALLVSTRQESAWRRFRRSAAFAAIGLAPAMTFIVWCDLSGGQSARPIGFHLVSRTRNELLNHFANFLFGTLFSQNGRVLGLWLVCAVLVVIFWRSRRHARVSGHDNEARALVLFVALAIVAYVVVVAISRTFLDVAVVIDPRLMMPVRGLFYAVLIAVAYRSFAARLSRTHATAVVALLVAIPIGFGWNAQRAFLAEYKARPRHTTALERELAAAPHGALIATNRPDLVYMTTGRSSIVFPDQIVRASGDRNPHYEADMRELADLLRERGGYVLAYSQFIPDKLLTAADLSTLVPLQRVGYSATVGTLYKVTPGQGTPLTSARARLQ